MLQSMVYLFGYENERNQGNFSLACTAMLSQATDNYRSCEKASLTLGIYYNCKVNLRRNNEIPTLPPELHVCMFDGHGINLNSGT